MPYVSKEKLRVVFRLRSERPAKSYDYRVSRSRTSLQREIKAGLPPQDIPRGLNIGNEALEGLADSPDELIRTHK